MQTEQRVQPAIPVETGAEELLATLWEQGVRYIFANLGTDYPALVEAFARARALGATVPTVIICQHEILALSAAQGYAQVTRQPQAVFVHVDVGTANLGGTVHNAARGRVPVFIFAGQSPWTTRGEVLGSRTNPVQFIQDAPDQAAIVRQYVKWAYEVKSPLTIRQVVQRALQVARAEPAGPVYLMAAREPLAARVTRNGAPARPADAVPAPSVPADPALAQAADWLLAAERPVVVTSYLGRDPAAVPELVALAERLALPVVEQSAYHLNFPRTHPLHLGARVAPYLPHADLVFVIDHDVPWLPAVVNPAPQAKVIHLDIDPVKAGMQLVDIPADLRLQGTSALALRRLRELVEARLDASAQDRIAARRAWVAERREQLRTSLSAAQAPKDGQITAAQIAATLGRLLPPTALVLDESVSNAPWTLQLTARTEPGTYFGSGGSSLGWGLGAALGAKLAAPDRDVVLCVGDGAFVFGEPTATFWAARRYQVPFLAVIYNNVGWAAVKNAALDQYPEGFAQRTNDFTASFAPSADLAMIAAAAGAYAERVTDPAELEAALTRGLAETRRGRAAAIEVAIVPV
jgi:acetolactate synthase-1/2/3 large subunit